MVTIYKIKLLYKKQYINVFLLIIILRIITASHLSLFCMYSGFYVTLTNILSAISAPIQTKNRINYCYLRYLHLYLNTIFLLFTGLDLMTDYSL